MRTVTALFFLCSLATYGADVYESNITAVATMSTNDKVRISTAAGLTRLATTPVLSRAIAQTSNRYIGQFEGVVRSPVGGSNYFGGDVKIVGSVEADGIDSAGSVSTADIFYGGGSGITNIDGANVQVNTINSNKFDAATRALLGTGGTVSDFVSLNVGTLNVTSSVPHERVFLVTAFGAKGNGIQRMGSIPVGSSTLTIETNGCFTTNDIGKIIIINGVGNSSNILNSFIAGVTASNICTIAGVATTEILPHGDHQNVVYGDDDTVAIQAGINYVSTNGGGTLYFPYTTNANRAADKNGTIYMVNGPLINYWTNSYQLKIPELPPIGQMSWTVKLAGPQAPAARQFVDVGSLGRYPHAEDWGKSGVTLWSTRPTGYLGQGKKAMIGAWNTNTPSYEFDLYGAGTNAIRVGWNAVRLEIENLTFRVSPNPDMVALCLDACATIRLRSVWVDCGWNEYQGPEPTNTASIGIDFPPNNNSGGGSLRCSDTVVSGFYTGMRLNEHAEVDNCCVTSCKRAYWIQNGGHEVTLINANAEGCLYAIYLAGTGAGINCYGLSIENSVMYLGVGNWWRPAYILYEENDGYYNGFIEYTYTTSDHDLQKHNGKWITTRRKPNQAGAVSTYMTGKAGTNADLVWFEGWASANTGSYSTNGQLWINSNATLIVKATPGQPGIAVTGRVDATEFYANGVLLTNGATGGGANPQTIVQTNTLGLGSIYQNTGSTPGAFEWIDSGGNRLFTVFHTNIYYGIKVGNPNLLPQWSQYVEAGYAVQSWPKSNTMCFSAADNPGTDSGSTRVIWIAPTTLNVNVGASTADAGFKLNVEGAGRFTNVFITAPTNGVAPPSLVNQPVGLFGSMMLTATQSLGGASDVYIALTNYGTIRTNGFIANPTTGYLTNLYAGFYRINFYLSALPGNSDMLEGEINVNGTGREEISFYHVFDNPARVGTASGSGVLYLPAMSGICFQINNRSSTSPVACWRAGFTIGTP